MTLCLLVMRILERVTTAYSNNLFITFILLLKNGALGNRLPNNLDTASQLPTSSVLTN